MRVKQVSTLSLSFLVSRPGAKWNIEVHQEECDGEVEEDQDQVEIVTEEVPILTTEEPVKEGITWHDKYQSNKTSINGQVE